MTTNTKIKLAFNNLLHATKKLLFSPAGFFTELLDSLVDPLAQDELQRQKSLNLPPELRFAYQRDWNYTTLSEIRAEAGRKGGKVKKQK